MGVSAADYDCDGNLDIVKTNFVGDTATLYHNLGNFLFEDETFQSGLGKNTRFLSWGVCFMDFDNDGWADILITNGHVYPEVGETLIESGYRERKVLYKNLRNGRFADVSLDAGPGINELVPGRGCAVGDYNNDGLLDVLVNCTNDYPQLLRCNSTLKNNWIRIKTIGVKSNRSGIGARIYCSTPGHRQMDEVRSGASYVSQSDLRVHFGLGPAETADLEIRWPSGEVDHLTGVKANQDLIVKEGSTKRGA